MNEKHEQDINYFVKNDLLAREIPVWVSLLFQGKKDLDDAKDDLKRWHRDIDRQLLGNNFHRIPKDKRSFMYACPEYIGTKNLHFHILIIPAENQVGRFIEIAEDTWKRIDDWKPYPKKNPEESYFTSKRILKYTTEDFVRPFDLVILDNQKDRKNIIGYTFKDNQKSINNNNNVITDDDFYSEVMNNKGREMLNARKQVAVANRFSDFTY
jgi:hypothetical protein